MDSRNHQNEEAIAFRKAADYCASQERCTSEMLLKLKAWGIGKEVAERITDRLKSEGFIDEPRYAKAFARGKFRILRWGRIKIKAELRVRQIDAAAISSALHEIDESEYLQCLADLLRKKLKELGGADTGNRIKAYRFAMGKGFEPELIQKTLRLNNY